MAWMFELLVGPSRSIRPPHHRAWLERFDLDRPNLRGAVERALHSGDATTVSNLVRESIGYLTLREAEAETAEWLDRALRCGRHLTPLVRTQLLMARSVLVGALGRYDEARTLLAEARDSGVVSDDPLDIALAAMATAVVVSSEGHPNVALDAAVAAAEAMDAIDSDIGQTYMWQTAGTIALSCDPRAADTYLGKALSMADDMDNDGLRGQAHTLLGYSARRDGRHDEARRHFIAAAEAALRSGQRSSMAYALDGLAAVAVDTGRPTIVAQALACSTIARADLERTSWASFRPLIDEIADRARSALGDEVFESIRADGIRFDVHDMLDEALDALTASNL